jgi:hypothetical protein
MEHTERLDYKKLTQDDIKKSIERENELIKFCENRVDLWDKADQPMLAKPYADMKAAAETRLEIYESLLK